MCCSTKEEKKVKWEIEAILKQGYSCEEATEKFSATKFICRQMREMIRNFEYAEEEFSIDFFFFTPTTQIPHLIMKILNDTYHNLY